MTGLLLLLLAVGSEEEALIQLYREDPLQLRAVLRQRLEEGVDNGAAVEILRSRFEDHSFDDLAGDTNRLAAGPFRRRRARRLWEEGRLPEAVEAYLSAALRLKAAGADIETLFALYSAAAVLAEQERYRSSLRVAATALALRDSRSAPLVDALLHESCGYALWLLDRLPESAAAFERSLQSWTRIGYGTALVAGHNNLAALWEALRLPDRAAAAYSRAGAAVEGGTLPEVRLQLWRNWSLFELRRGKIVTALALLDRARPLRRFDPSGFDLWEAETIGSIVHLKPPSEGPPSHTIQWRLTAARIELASGRVPEAEAHLRLAHLQARTAGLPLLIRHSAEELGYVLEQLQRFEEAAEIYGRTYASAAVLDHADSSRPYMRLISPLLSGWIRALVAQGRWREARTRIHTLVGVRSQRAGRLRPASQEPPASQREAAASWTTVELWPESDRLMAWIDADGGTSFRLLSWNDALQQALVDVVGRFDDLEGLLPPRPPRTLLEALYRAIIAPLESQLGTGALLIVPHRQLQSLPFEMLIDGGGKYLGETRAVSYLPSPVERARPAAAFSAASEELLLTAAVLAERPAAQREWRTLQQLFPDATRLHDLAEAPKRARWLHVSTHLQLAEDDWLDTILETDSGPLRLQQFVQRVPACDLLTLGTCDSAPSRWSRLPYWLGLSEVLLAGGVDSLLVTRWKLDERSSDLFLDFYQHLRRGTPMDEALLKARLRYLRGAEQWRRHPFYWAGVAYVGQPARRLYPDRSALWPCLVTALASAGLFRLATGRRLKKTQVTVPRLEPPRHRQRRRKRVQ